LENIIKTLLINEEIKIPELENSIRALLGQTETISAHIDKTQHIQTEINNDVYKRLALLMDFVNDIYKI
jgi:hypothetical protein